MRVIGSSLRFTLIFGIVATIALSAVGCYKFDEFDVSMQGNALTFSSNEIDEGLAKGNNYLLLDLQVERTNCETDCTVWFVVRRNDDSILTDNNHLDSSITYGMELTGMEERVRSRALKAGRYLVAGTVRVYDKTNEFQNSMTLSKEFILVKQESGKLLVKFSSDLQ